MFERNCPAWQVDTKVGFIAMLEGTVFDVGTQPAEYGKLRSLD